MLAAIGEQFEGHLAPGDEVCGISVSVRDRDDLLQIWNYESSLTSQATVMKKVHSLVPDVVFSAEFYKRKCCLPCLGWSGNMCIFCCLLTFMKFSIAR